MTQHNAHSMTPADAIASLRVHWRRWLIPAIAVTVLGAAYAYFKPAAWEATQALVVRDEAMGTEVRPGKFQQPDDMKAAQETVLELARSRAVLRAALADVGPGPEHDSTKPWPSAEAIAGLADTVKLAPPKGAEFGKTEVFYLSVKAETPARALALTEAICRHLQLRSRELRDQKAQGLVAELTKTAEIAKADLNTTTDSLKQIETEVGSDLGELRVLEDVGGGDSPLRRSINEMETELRQARVSIDAHRELLSLLKTSKEDTEALLAAPNRLFEAHPVLRRLKDGLVDAQLRTSQLEGNMSDAHPLVIAAQTSEAEIEDHVRSELDSAIRGTELELRLANERASVLERQLASAQTRLAKLAGMRAEYGNVVAERNRRMETLRSAEQQLAEARASQVGAATTSMITAIDEPVASDTPAGPSKSMIVAASGCAGLLLGLAIVFLTVQPSPSAAAEQAALGTVAPLADQAEREPITAGPFAVPFVEPSTQTAVQPVAATKWAPSQLEPASLVERNLNRQNEDDFAHVAAPGGLSLKQALWKVAESRGR